VNSVFSGLEWPLAFVVLFGPGLAFAAVARRRRLQSVRLRDRISSYSYISRRIAGR